MRDLFTRYDPSAPSEEREGSPVCVASYPEPCGEPAVGEGWGCLALCEGHWREAEMAAREELAEALDNELETLEFAENQRRHKNEAVVWALRGAGGPGLEWAAADSDAYDAARAAAFPTEGREDLTDPDTLAHDYGRPDEGDGPVEWWSDERYLLLYFMRRASGEGLARLMRDLEVLRERVTVQLALAERDLDRRYVPRARREAGG